MRFQDPLLVRLQIRRSRFLCETRASLISAFPLVLNELDVEFDHIRPKAYNRHGLA